MTNEIFNVWTWQKGLLMSPTISILIYGNNIRIRRGKPSFLYLRHAWEEETYF